MSYIAGIREAILGRVDALVAERDAEKARADEATKALEEVAKKIGAPGEGPELQPGPGTAGGGS